jgi:excisionase family DNA binding protein
MLGSSSLGPVSDVEYLSTGQVAQELAVSMTIVAALVRSGKLPAQRLPGNHLASSG